MSIVIIGGGVAGLSCGCYLQMNGYQTQILETNPVPGGLCVAWDRGSYTFDGCLRWLVGTHPSSSFYRIWQELGALADRSIINDEEFIRVEDVQGQTLPLPADLDQVAAEFKRVAPEDARRIDHLVAAARRCAPLDPPDKPLELMSGPEKMKLLVRYLPILLTVARWKNRGFAEYLAEFRNPFLRDALKAVVGDTRMSALVLVMLLGWRSRQNAGYVAGGSRAFVDAMAQRYVRLGGTLRYQTRVASVTVQQDRATGVQCTNGSTLAASRVISCADGFTTHFKMLGGRHLDKQTRYVYDHCDVFPSVLQASLGVNLALREKARSISFPLTPPLQVDPSTRHERLEVALFGAETALCPPGKTILITRFASNYEYWAKLRSQPTGDYAKAKQALLQEIVRVLDRRFPGVASKLEQADLATPATFARYTGNWQGSIQGWLPTPRILGRRLKRTVPGLSNFYLAGQWIEPGGGLPSAALSGRYTAQLICAQDGKAFTTTVA